METKGKSTKLQPTAVLQRESLLSAPADNRRQKSHIPKDVIETGQCWRAAEEDGVQEIFVETVAQFVAAVESLDQQDHGKWGRCVHPERPNPGLIFLHIWIRSGFVFRGLPNYKWELLTSLMRCGQDHACKVELPIVRAFKQ